MCQRYVPKPVGWVGTKVGFRVVCVPKIVQNLEHHRWIKRSRTGFCNHGSFRSQRHSMEGWQSKDMLIQKLQLTRQPLQESCTAAGGRWSQLALPSSLLPAETTQSQQDASLSALAFKLFLPGNYLLDFADMARAIRHFLTSGAAKYPPSVLQVLQQKRKDQIGKHDTKT